jgi:hypothetical protein
MYTLMNGTLLLLLPCHDGRALLLEQEASETCLKGILGFETRPLVSTDYVNDARSSIVDAACTQVGWGTVSAGGGAGLATPLV